MPRRPKKPPFIKVGVAQSIATKAEKIYVTKRRPIVRVIQQEGAEFEVKHVHPRKKHIEA